MAKVELHYLFSPDLGDPETDSPLDPTNFMVRIQALIGIEGNDTFVFYVCTPQYLAGIVGEGEYLLGRHYLVVARYDYNLIHRVIEEIVAKTPDGEWKTQANYLARYGEWEYEGSEI